MIDDGGRFGDDLGHRAGQVDRVGFAGEALDDRRLGLLPGVDQGARKARAGNLLRGRIEEQVQRVLDDRAALHLDEGELLEEGGREGGEGPGVDAGDAAEELVRGARITVAGATAHGQPCRQFGRREAGVETPVDEDELDRTGEPEGVDGGSELRPVDRRRPAERRLRDRRDVGEAPLLLAQRREALTLVVLPGEVAQGAPALGLRGSLGARELGGEELRRGGRGRRAGLAGLGLFDHRTG